MKTLYYRTTIVPNRQYSTRLEIPDTLFKTENTVQDWKYPRHCSRRKIQYKIGNTREIVQDRKYSTRLEITEKLLRQKIQYKTGNTRDIVQDRKYSTRLERPETLFNTSTVQHMYNKTGNTLDIVKTENTV